MEQRARYVERWGQQFESAGLQRTAGRIWGSLLVAEDGVQTLGELAETLGLSKGGISTTARWLEESGLIERLGTPGSRRVSYRVCPDSIRVLLEQKVRSVERWVTLLEDGTQLAGPGVDGPLVELLAGYQALEHELRRVLDSWNAGRRA